MPRPRIHGLTQRRLSVLRAVVREYVRGGRPVGSETVRSKYNLRASSATIRLDMAALDRMGLLRQLHASGGRVPTPAGYRTYVRHLTPGALGSREEVYLRLALRAVQDVTHAAAFIARALADITHLVALAVPPLSRELKLTAVELRQISSNTVALKYRLSDGTTGETLAHLKSRISSEQADQWNQALAALEPQSLADLAAFSPREDWPSLVWQALVEHLLKRAGVLVLSQGASYLAALGQSEPGLDLDLARTLAVVEDPAQAYALLTSVQPGSQARTLIGAKDTGGKLPQCSVVVAAFGLHRDAPSGRVAVVGPMRMHYEHNIAATSHAARLLDEVWQRQAAGE